MLNLALAEVGNLKKKTGILKMAVFSSKSLKMGFKLSIQEYSGYIKATSTISKIR